MRRGTAFFLLVAMLAIAAVVLIGLRPARVVGVSDEALAYSLKKSIGGESEGSCLEKDEGDWICAKVGERESGGPTATYVVDTSGWGCWTAARVQKNSKLPPVMDGCITILDLVRLGD